MRLLIILALHFPIAALAAGGEGIPTKLIITQAVNFSLALFILYYLTRRAIANHFLNRHEEYNVEVKKAEAAREDAEKKRRELSERLNKLQSTKEESVNLAKAEAESMKRKILNEAVQISNKLSEDAKRTYEYELVRSLEKLRKEILSQSIIEAEVKMKNKVDGQVLQRMRHEFVEKIQVVPR